MLLINIEVQYFLDSAEFSDLVTFYKTTLNNGTDFFDWVDPIDSSAASF